MRLKFNMFSVLVLFLVMMFTTSCVSLRAAFNSELTPKQRLTIAYKDYNDNLQDYLAMYRAASVETQARWKKNIDPRFKQAKAALDAWDVALGSPGEEGKEADWINFKDQLMVALFQYGIIKLE